MKTEIGIQVWRERKSKKRLPRLGSTPRPNVVQRNNMFSSKERAATRPKTTTIPHDPDSPANIILKRSPLPKCIKRNFI